MTSTMVVMMVFRWNSKLECRGEELREQGSWDGTRISGGIVRNFKHLNVKSLVASEMCQGPKLKLMKGSVINIHCALNYFAIVFLQDVWRMNALVWMCYKSAAPDILLPGQMIHHPNDICAHDVVPFHWWMRERSADTSNDTSKTYK